MTLREGISGVDQNKLCTTNCQQQILRFIFNAPKIKNKL